jgi:hypothetical protein
MATWSRSSPRSQEAEGAMGEGTLRVAAITVSDTRTLEDDEGGARLRERLEAAGSA